MTSLCVGLVQSSAFCQAARLFALTEDWRPGIEGKLHLSRRGTLNTASFQSISVSEVINSVLKDANVLQRSAETGLKCKGRYWSDVTRSIHDVAHDDLQKKDDTSCNFAAYLTPHPTLCTSCLCSAHLPFEKITSS